MLKTVLKTKKSKVIFFLAVAVMSFLITSVGISKTGQTWDEIAYYNAGREYIKSAAELDFSQDAWRANKEHPGFAKYIYGLASVGTYLNHEQNFNPGRIASAVMLALAIALAAYFAATNFSLIAGVATALVLSLSPSFMAYGRVLGMDSITALMFTLVALTFYNFAKSKGGWRDYIIPSLVFGIAINTRYNLILSLALLPVAVALFSSWNKNFFRWIALITIPILACLVFYLTWPFLWHGPIQSLQESLGHWGNVREWYLSQPNVLPPHSYYLVYFLATTPVMVLVLFLIGVFKKPFDKNKVYLIAWLLIPFLQSFFGLKQNGIRYLLPVWIPLAILSALGFEYLFLILKPKWARVVLLALFCGYLVFNTVNYYPYYLDYYNEAVGGAKGVFEKRLLQLGWWGEGGEEAANYINQNAGTGARIYSGFIPTHTLGSLRSDLKMVKKDENPDYIVLSSENLWVSEFQIPQNYAIIHSVKAGGAPIVQIYIKNE